jgi:hypothetical protein
MFQTEVEGLNEIDTSCHVSTVWTNEETFVRNKITFRLNFVRSASYVTSDQKTLWASPNIIKPIKQSKNGACSKHKVKPAYTF